MSVRRSLDDVRGALRQPDTMFATMLRTRADQILRPAGALARFDQNARLPSSSPPTTAWRLRG